MSLWSRLSLICALAAASSAAERLRSDLNGAWEFRLDPEDAGPPGAFEATIQVPGAWQAQGFGQPAGILRHHYAGTAWYRRHIAVPASWQGKRIRLHVGGALRGAALYIDGRKAGEHDGFTTPFWFDLTGQVRAGADHAILLRVANPGPAVTDAPHDQRAAYPIGMLNYVGNWGGIYGNVYLEATEPVWIDEVAATPRSEERAASFHVLLQRLASEPAGVVRVEVIAGDDRAAQEASWNGTRAEATVRLAMPGATPWSPERPHLYPVTVRVLESGRERDRLQQRVGLREIAVRGKMLLLNGKPLYLRGYGDDNIEVLTGVPPASKEVYLARLRQAKAFGFNAVRFHSMTPVREFFEAADEVGILVMAELPAAYTMHFLPHKRFLRAELERVLRAYRNHPSFLSLALGNELNEQWLKTDREKQEFHQTVQEFYHFAKSLDPTRLILSNDGILLRPTDLFSLFRGAPQDAPTVRHEFGSYYCSLPDISLIGKFTGVIQPAWLEEKKRWVEESGLRERYPVYVRNSQRLQQLGRKYQIERVRRNPEVTGYHYWLIVDFPGGTGEGDSWEEGWFDYFWRPKNIEATEGREINSPVLLMIGAGVDDRSLWSERGKDVDVFVSNYGETALDKGTLTWELVHDGKTHSRGSATGLRAPLGQVTRLTRISIPPVPGEQARKVQLVLKLRQDEAEYSNRWDLWAFPRKGLLDRAARPVVSAVRRSAIERVYPFVSEAREPVPPDAVWITPTLTREALRFLKAGGRVWLLAGRSQFGRSGEGSFFPASGGALGTVIERHAALQGFPHDGFVDLQFFNLMEGAWPFALDHWPHETAPIAGGIRTTSSFLSKAKKLSRVGFIFEAAAGKGKLLVTTLRLQENLDEAHPEAVHLFDRLLRYAASDAFQPAFAMGDHELERLMVE